MNALDLCGLSLVSLLIITPAVADVITQPPTGGTGTPAGPSKPYLDVTAAPVSMKESSSSVFDNGPLVQTLMTAIAPFSAATGDAGYPVMFPSDNTQNQTYYYFSAPLLLARSGTFFCGNAPLRGATAVSLIFAPGVDGVIWDSGYNTPDGGWSEANLQGCGIRSLGFGAGSTTSGSNQLTSAAYLKTYGPINGPGYQVGDGLIVKDKSYSGNPLATNPGATITAVSGSTLTLSVNANATATVATYQLPAAKAYSVTTTSGSNSVTTTGGPTWKIQSGDLIWSDAFTFGCTVWSATGSAGAQTLLIVDARANNTACNATVTHAAGSGKLWIVPAALKRNQTSYSAYNYIYGWPIGMLMPCSGGMTPAINCTSSYDQANVYESNLVGRWTAGNNTGASISIAENFTYDYRYDIMEGGSVGSTYIANTTNSNETSTAPSSITGLCNTQNYSVFIGSYGQSGQSYCLTPTDLYNGAIGGGNYGASVIFLGPIYNAPNDTSSIQGGGFLVGPQKFSGNPGTNPNTGEALTMYMSGGDYTKNGGVNFGFSKDATQTNMFRLTYYATDDWWQWQFFNNWPFEAFPGPSYGSLGGYAGDAAGGFNYPYFLTGVMLNGENAGGNAVWGAERMLDYQTTVSAGTWHKQGDISFNRAPVAGGTMAWTDTAAGANFYPAAPIALDTAGKQWSLPIVINTSNTFATLPACAAGLKGAHQFITDGAASPVFSAAAAGGGALFTPVYCDGTSWRNG